MKSIRVISLVTLAVPLLPSMDLALETIGFRRVANASERIARLISRLRSPHSQPERIVVDVSHAVRIADALYLRKKKNCLPRAWTIFLLLSAWGVPAQFVIGVKQFPFNAHSWTEWNGHPILENPQRIERFTPIKRMG